MAVEAPLKDRRGRGDFFWEAGGAGRERSSGPAESGERRRRGGMRGKRARVPLTRRGSEKKRRNASGSSSTEKKGSLRAFFTARRIHQRHRVRVIAKGRRHKRDGGWNNFRPGPLLGFSLSFREIIINSKHAQCFDLHH